MLNSRRRNQRFRRGSVNDPARAGSVSAGSGPFDETMINRRASPRVARSAAHRYAAVVVALRNRAQDGTAPSEFRHCSVRQSSRCVVCFVMDDGAGLALVYIRRAAPRLVVQPPPSGGEALRELSVE